MHVHLDSEGVAVLVHAYMYIAHVDNKQELSQKS